MTAENTIAYQGMPGAYSHLACKTRFPDMIALPYASFEEMLEAVETGKAKYAMVPVENSLAGRVADIHHLLPSSGLHIIGEHFQRVNHQLLGLHEANIDSIKAVYSHAQGLAQCRNIINKLKIKPITHTDTAGAAADVAANKNPEIAAIASSLAAEIYGLKILAENTEDLNHNTTRMLIMAKEQQIPQDNGEVFITTIIFSLRSVPAALYKALGGFATNSINLTKIESYISGGNFKAAQFYIDAECHQDSQDFKYALDEIKFFTQPNSIKILGCYKSARNKENNH